MSNTDQKGRAAALRALYTVETLVLPNAWDAGSARVIERAGARAIATTSAGVSWALGKPDGQHITRADQNAVIARIVDAVRVPVSADIEGGYGADPESVGATVVAVLEAGAVGINLEDSRAFGLPLFTEAEQSARIEAAREAAIEAGLPGLVINARTDVFLFQVGEPAERLDDVIRRSHIYAQAGADSLFVPGVADLDTIRALVERSPLPINIMVGRGAPSVPELIEAGVKRISLGSSLAETAYVAAEKASREILTVGTYGALRGSFSEVDSAFTPATS